MRRRRLRAFASGIISAHRRSAAVRALHDFAALVESAYANEGSSFEDNGERDLVNKLRPAAFRTAFDVGANLGDWSAEVVNAWPNCQVHAFEVAPRTFESLQERFRSAEYRDRVSLNCLGLSDNEGTQPMYYFPDHPELTCDLRRHDQYRAVPFDAELLTGDKYCDRHNIAEVDFLKIDVEGAEHRVLRGFAERVARQKIHCVQFEYGAFAAQTKFLLADYYALLSSTYWIGKIYPGYVDFCDYHWKIESFRFSNYCCVSRLRPDIRKLLAA